MCVRTRVHLLFLVPSIDGSGLGGAFSHPSSGSVRRREVHPRYTQSEYVTVYTVSFLRAMAEKLLKFLL